MKYLGNTEKTADMLQVAAGKIHLATDRGATGGGDNEGALDSQ